MIPVFTMLILFVKAQNSWVLNTDNEGIKVYTRTLSNSKIKAIKIETTIQATLSQIVTVIFDIKSSSQWVYRTKNCSIIKQLSPWDVYYYAEVDVPWPVNHRDFIAHLTLSQNPLSKIIVVNVENNPDLLPQKRNLIRVMQSAGKWVITPTTEHTINVEYSLFTDPGGNMPAWLINMFITLTIKLEDGNGTIETVGKPFIEVEKEGQGSGSFFVVLPKSRVHQRKTSIILGFYQGNKKITESKTNFLGPITE